MFPIIEGAGFPIIQRIAPQPCRAFPPSLPIFAGLLVGIWIAMACDEGLRGALFVGRFHRGAWRNKQLVD